MDNLVEVIKIVEGALSADRRQVRNYVELLAEKVEGAGDLRSAKHLRRALERSKFRDMQSMDQAGMGVSLPTDSESHFPLADITFEEQPHVFFPASVHRQVEDFTSFIDRSDDLIRNGVGIAPSMLLFGPPGCGKSEMAKYISSRLQLPLITSRADSLISSFLGSTSKNIRQLFNYAASRPCVLFLDEFDVLAKARDDAQELGELKRVVVSLLQNIDAVGHHTVLIAATNHEHLLDTAVWRRFAFRLRIGLPDEQQRYLMFRQYLSQCNDDVVLSALACLADGASGADIRDWCDSAIRKSIVSGEVHVDAMGLLYDIATQRSAFTTVENNLKLQVAQKLRDADEGRFTYRALSQLLGVSLGQLSKSLRGVG